MGPKDRYHVNTSPVYYKKIDVEYMGITATDAMQCQISEEFEKTSEFIDNALKGEGMWLTPGLSERELSFWRNLCHLLHWKLSILTTSSAASDTNFIKLTKNPFRCEFNQITLLKLGPLKVTSNVC